LIAPTRRTTYQLHDHHQSGLRSICVSAIAFARDIGPTKAADVTTLQGIAAALNEANIPTPRVVGPWKPRRRRVSHDDEDAPQ
jgi:hypothetical protein